MDDPAVKRKREDASGDVGAVKRMKEDSGGAGNRSGGPRRTVPVVVKTEQAKATAMQGAKRGEPSLAEIQKGKKAALAQAERTTGHFTGFDSPFGNYLVPSLPSFGAK